MNWMTTNMPIGSADRIIAEARPSAASARILRRILNRWRMTPERFSRISPRLPPVEPWMATAVTNSGRSSEPMRAIEIAHRGFEIGAVGDLVGDDAEFAADRIGHFAPDHGDGDRHRMAGAQAAHDDVERVGELGAEFLLPPRAQHFAAPIAAAPSRSRAPRRAASTTLPRNTMVTRESDHRDKDR